MLNTSPHCRTGTNKMHAGALILSPDIRPQDLTWSSNIAQTPRGIGSFQPQFFEHWGSVGILWPGIRCKNCYRVSAMDDEPRPGKPRCFGGMIPSYHQLPRSYIYPRIWFWHLLGYLKIVEACLVWFRARCPFDQKLKMDFSIADTMIRALKFGSRFFFLQKIGQLTLS